MPRAKGPIKYVEHQTPQTDESGKYIIHPQFVSNGKYTFKDMKRSVAEHRQVGSPIFTAAVDALERDALMALGMGKEVCIGDMFIIKPRLEVRRHKDAYGREWRNTYHEGDRIPASEVSLCGMEIRPTKAFISKFKNDYYRGCSRREFGTSVKSEDAVRELAEITEMCREKGFVTIKDVCWHFNFSSYQARKLLNGWCEGDFPKMTRERLGNTLVYRRIGV